MNQFEAWLVVLGLSNVTWNPYEPGHRGSLFCSLRWGTDHTVNGVPKGKTAADRPNPAYVLETNVAGEHRSVQGRRQHTFASLSHPSTAQVSSWQGFKQKQHNL